MAKGARLPQSVSENRTMVYCRSLVFASRRPKCKNQIIPSPKRRATPGRDYELSLGF